MGPLHTLKRTVAILRQFFAPNRLPNRSSGNATTVLEVELLETRALPGSILDLANPLPALGIAGFSVVDSKGTGETDGQSFVAGTQAYAGGQVSPSEATGLRKAPRGEQGASVAHSGIPDSWECSNSNVDAETQLTQLAKTASPLRPLITVIVQIDIPANNSTVPGGGTFTTFGYVSPTNAVMTAWVTDGATQYNGTRIMPIPHIPAYQWGFKFTGIPTGHQVSLTVQGNSNGTLGSSTITITCS